MRNSYIQSNAFSKVKLQVTMSLSNLVSSTISRINGALFSEHCLRRSFKTILCYLENDYINLNKICSDNVTDKERVLSSLNFSAQVRFFLSCFVCMYYFNYF